MTDTSAAITFLTTCCQCKINNCNSLTLNHLYISGCLFPHQLLVVCNLSLIMYLKCKICPYMTLEINLFIHFFFSTSCRWTMPFFYCQLLLFALTPDYTYRVIWCKKNNPITAVSAREITFFSTNGSYSGLLWYHRKQMWTCFSEFWVQLGTKVLFLKTSLGATNCKRFKTCTMSSLSSIMKVKQGNKNLQRQRDSRTENWTVIGEYQNQLIANVKY